MILGGGFTAHIGWVGFMGVIGFPVSMGRYLLPVRCLTEPQITLGATDYFPISTTQISGLPDKSDVTNAIYALVVSMTKENTL